MVELARVRLRSSRHKDTGCDEEDAALSAFDSVCAGLARGRFPQLSNRDELWSLLVVITTRKVQAQARRLLQQKRGSGQVRPASDLAGTRVGFPPPPVMDAIPVQRRMTERPLSFPSAEINARGSRFAPWRPRDE
jgi:hypothetical protein